jgi:hypothetical protein
VAADLDLTEGAAGRGSAAAAVLGVVLALAAAVAALLTGGAFAVLAGCVVGGAGLTYLAGLELSAEERLAYGTVVGAVVVSMLGFVLALAWGLTLATAAAAVLVTLALSAPGWWRARRLAPTELRDAAARWSRREPWPLWLLLAVAWPFTLVLLARAYQSVDGGLVAGNVGVWGDWAAHLAYAGSFAYGANFPPVFPVDPPHPLSYPFMVDFLAAGLVPFGTSLTSALVLSSGLLALAFPAVMYLAGVRLIGSRGGAALGVLVFALSGGLGFVYLAGDVARSGPAALRHLPQLFTQIPSQNYRWLNPVLAWMLPQRSVLFGFCLALLIMALLWQASRLERRAWAPFAFAGVIAGLTPLFQLHAYGTVVALAAFWVLLTPRREWLAYFLPALVLAAPAVIWMLRGGAATVHVQLWWMADTENHHDGPVWFWLKNTGLFIPALVAAFAWKGLLPPRLALHLAPIWLWFLVPNVLVFQPWDWDNTKFFAYWALFGSLLVGALLAALLRRDAPERVLAVALAVVLMLAGGLDLARSLDTGIASNEIPVTDAAGLQAAAWVRDHTERHAVFLVAPDADEPVSSLGGRRVVAGYPGWLWSYGLGDWATRPLDVHRMLAGDPSTQELLRRYGVDYVVLGPAETGTYGARRAYWDRMGQAVYVNGSYTIYRLR